ncbi:MAG: hypothetical protein WCP77_18145, partial [Roseococcus sp.]
MHSDYIFIRSLHWLSIGMQLRQHYRALGREAILIGRRDMEQPLADIGLRHGEDFLTIQSFGQKLQGAPPKHLCVSLHHHKKSLDEWRLLGRHLSPESRVSLSFFADGYNNLLINREDILAFLQSNPGILPRDLLYFDVAPPDAARHGQNFSVVTAFSDGIRNMAELPYFQEKSQIAVQRCVADARGRPILLVMLRPWGSDVFHGGLLNFADAAGRLKDIILVLIQSIMDDLGHDVHVVLRPDGRDAELM